MALRCCAELSLARAVCRSPGIDRSGVATRPPLIQRGERPRWNPSQIRNEIRNKFAKGALHVGIQSADLRGVVLLETLSRPLPQIKRPLPSISMTGTEHSGRRLWVADRQSLAKAEWLQSVCDRRVRRSRPTRQDYTSVCSAISSASSTSIPRYLTVLSSLL